MQKVAAQIAICRKIDAPVHHVGERGVGKEHVARLVHYSSPRRLQRFVPMACGMLSHYELKTLLTGILESDAQSTNLGTVYLEHVDRVPRDLQELLVEQIVRQKSQTRWMSSSEGDLAELDEKQFSQELACYLTAVTIHIPPLRERGADLLLLAQQLLEETNRDQEQQVTGFSADVEKLFLKYSWPANVDELATTLHSARAKCADETIEAAHLPLEFRVGLDAQGIAPKTSSINLEQFLQEAEREQIERALLTARGNKQVAARLLGIPRAKLYRRMSALNLDGSSHES